MAMLGRNPTPDPVHKKGYFLDIYLDAMKRAAGTGQRLLDVLDVHWYPESRADGVRITEYRAVESRGITEARLQAPRSLWDPTFDEHTWVTEAAGGPVRLLDRMRQSTAVHYPGTKLAISEYFFGGADKISGAIAEADVLGILGRERVFAASVWPAAGAPSQSGRGGGAYSYLFGAFNMYLNYDGAGSRFGDVGVMSTTNDPVHSSVYASLDDANRLVIVAINKSVATPVSIAIGGRSGSRVKVYTLTSGAPNPRAAGETTVGPSGQIAYTMPEMSVSTLVVAP
jgi:hypothetical protein